jgi:excisionase family DNA binding protein
MDRILYRSPMQIPDIEKEFMTVSQAARICNVTRVTMWRWVKAGSIQSSATAGGHHRINRDDLAEFIKAHRMGARLQNDSVKPRILIVDDEPSLQRYLFKILTPHGYEIQACADGFEAGVYVMKFRPQLILLDLYMPRVDGFQTCRLIKNELETAHIKIIAISGNFTAASIERILECGADGILKKPLDRQAVIQEIASLIEET